MKTKKAGYILASVCILSLVMNLAEILFTPTYFLKSLLKMVLFLAAPMGYFLKNREERPALKKLFSPSKAALLRAAVLGLVCYGGIVGGYLLVRDYVDFSGITKSLAAGVGVSAENFLYVSVYISLCNSFLEEFFFRGFGFLVLKTHTNRVFAHIFSAVLFALYHIGMTLGWVAPFLFCLELVGLVIGGLLLNFLDEPEASILPSWLTHMFINFGINTVGCILFGIL